MGSLYLQAGLGHKLVSFTVA